MVVVIDGAFVAVVVIYVVIMSPPPRSAWRNVTIRRGGIGPSVPSLYCRHSHGRYRRWVNELRHIVGYEYDYVVRVHLYDGIDDASMVVTSTSSVHGNASGEGVGTATSTTASAPSSSSSLSSDPTKYDIPPLNNLRLRIMPSHPAHFAVPSPYNTRRSS